MPTLRRLRASVRALPTALLLAAATPASAAAAGPSAEPAPRITVSPAEITIGASATVSGQAGSAGVALELQGESYPFHSWDTLATAVSAPDGTFAFPAIAPQANTRLRIATAAGPDSETQLLTVDPAVALAARTLGPGRTLLSIRLRHAAGVRALPVPALWFVGDGRGTPVLAATTITRELPGHVTYASAVVDPPARHFRYRVCLNATWEHAMGTRAEHGRCPRAPTHAGRASGIPLVPFPGHASIAAAWRFLESRAGRTAFAIVDSSGSVSGVRIHEHFESASVVKVMMLTAYLQRLAAAHRGLTAADTQLLYPMIHISDNEAASAVLARVGEGALARVAREAGMSDYAPGVGWWAFTQTSAADQARMFAALPRLVPARFYGYARYLLSTIEPSQSWGVPPVARPRWQVFFKTGALPSQGLFSEAARLERGPLSFSLAVFTDGEPSMAYGEQTIEGVAAALLAHTP
ncbi:MAG TPA: serine hydrolase [Solirubrobacteraceae bacterium]|jgi:hypothetical protein|nr:serine hydrolase [Solirubrobacteraceae bacterium]